MTTQKTISIDARIARLHAITPHTHASIAEDIKAVLDELHRLHHAIALETAKTRRLQKKHDVRKPAAARSHAATTHKPGRKSQ